MKSRLVLSVFVLGLAACGFGNVVIGNFENDGLDLNWGFDGTTGSIVTGTGNTVGDNAMQWVRAAGGWGGSFEFYVGGSAAQSILAANGLVTVDVTAFGTDFPAGWAQIALMVNAGYGDSGSWAQIHWGTHDWQGAVLDTTTTMTFQMSQEAMDALAVADGWANLGFIMMTGDNSADPITGEPVYPSMATFYLDNVQAVVPEPATMALLGLGGLLSLRRKH